MPPSPTPRDPREEIADLLDGFPANEDELDAARDTWCDLDESEQRFQLARLAVARFRQGEAIRVSLARLERAAIGADARGEDAPGPALLRPLGAARARAGGRAADGAAGRGRLGAAGEEEGDGGEEGASGHRGRILRARPGGSHRATRRSGRA
jgi:hypothetical protein